MFGQILHRHGPDDHFIKVNVGGSRQKVARSLLRRFPQSRLARLSCCGSQEAILELCDDFSPTDMEYYFDRSPSLFCYVLNFYLTGKLHLDDGVCVISFAQEIEYWGIKERYLDLCCGERFQELMELVTDQGLGNDSESLSMSALSLSEDEEEMFEGSWCAETRRNVWLRLENPTYSKSAKAIAVASLSVVLVSIVAMCVHSLPDFHHVDENDQEIEDPILATLENICVVLFSVEFIIRLAVAPSPWRFLSNSLNLIDLMSVMPFYITLIYDLVDDGENNELENVGKVVQILRLMRVFRILKLARHSAGLRSLGATLRHSAHEMRLLVLFLSVSISVFSTLTYFVEKESPESLLQNIPICWWWATISMTTVGYGDTYPVTLPGKLIGTLCIVSGLLIVALPITNIFNKFSIFYERQRLMDLNKKKGLSGE
ncbi:delayed-rectifier potassium channel regulatory subunit KCNS3-like [Synchiropus picturatus]